MLNYFHRNDISTAFGKFWNHQSKESNLAIEQFWTKTYFT
jgi:hypothetical protein